ncbi:MAG: DUF2800 domain-containing protein [Oscillospiraceae bacterium]
MPDVHALLSASAAKRWINCPPSVRLTENMPDTPSEFAAEGTLAHELAELKLRKKFEVMPKSKYTKALDAIKANPLYAAEMDSCTDEYLDFILTIAHRYDKTKPYVVIEKQLNYSHIAQGGFGTSDCVLICKNNLHIIDFKYGKGVPVSVEDNPQLKLYALGAIAEYSMLYCIENVFLHIVQPRTGEGSSSWETSAAALAVWGESIKPIAELAYNGSGEFKCGDWCRFCKAKATCRARAENFFALEDIAKMPKELLSDSEIGEALVKAQTLKNWVTDLEEYALNAILSGSDITGWKAVEGRSNRKITDVDSAFEVLKSNGYDEALLYERKPITLTELEKLVTKKKLEELIGDKIVKPQGKPTLAPVDDKRKPYKPDINEMFGGN